MSLDLVFSNWIFLWFILYLLKVVTYNPSFILLASLLLLGLEVYLAIIYELTKYNIIKFITINTILKLIPLGILYSMNAIKIKLVDIQFTLILFSVYLVYLYANGTNIYEIYYKLLNVYITNSADPMDKTIFSRTYDYLYAKIF